MLAHEPYGETAIFVKYIRPKQLGCFILANFFGKHETEAGTESTGLNYTASVNLSSSCEKAMISQSSASRSVWLATQGTKSPCAVRMSICSL
jgi:hypothetical protein